MSASLAAVISHSRVAWDDSFNFLENRSWKSCFSRLRRSATCHLWSSRTLEYFLTFAQQNVEVLSSLDSVFQSLLLYLRDVVETSSCLRSAFQYTIHFVLDIVEIRFSSQAIFEASSLWSSSHRDVEHRTRVIAVILRAILASSFARSWKSLMSL